MGPPGYTQSDAGTDDTDTETDTGTETDTSTADTDTQTDTDTDTQTDTETDTSTADTDTQTDTDTDTQTDTDTTDTDTELRSVMEVPLPFSDTAWIDNDDNELGIQGWWYYYADENSSIAVSSLAENTICVNGEAVHPDDGNYTDYYGAKVGFNLCASLQLISVYSLEACPWSENLVEQLAGVAFDISGEVPLEVRVQFWEQNRSDGTYVVISQEGDHSIRMENAAIGYDSDADPLDISAVQSILFYVPSSQGTTSFSFCITNLRALVYV